MKKLLLPAIAAMLCLAILSAPAQAQRSAEAAVVPMPAGTASPRDWSKLAPDGNLLPTAVKGDSAILIDARTGKVLFEKDADAKRYPASTTKMMTCLLALESGKNLKDIVTVGKLPAADFASDSDRIGLQNGESIAFEDLLAGMMVKSGNDAADAIAIYVGGSIDNFKVMMNQKAQSLGMTGTHYTNTNGLADDTDHYTTARDMVTLAREAIKYPEFVKLVSYASYTIPETNKTTKERKYDSTNKLLGKDVYGYTYATGIKTGFTSMAMHCLISSARKGGMLLIAAEMHTPEPRTNLWTDAVTMFEYGFINYDTLDVQDLFASQNITIPIKSAASDDSSQGSLQLEMRPKPESQRYITDIKSEIDKLKADPSLFQQEMTITKDTAPIARDEQVGTVTYFFEGKPVLICELLASRNVELMATPKPSVEATATAGASGVSPANPSANSTASTNSTSGSMGTLVVWLAVAALLLALTTLTIRLIITQRRSKRYRQYNLRQKSSTHMRR
jgi:serine-type D-Ala-D-Ala carboxypeptidase (penicillin-binding protein 5/6)